MKNILLVVTSSISCYKSYDICSKLVKNGYNVNVIMSKNSTKLISADIFAILSKNKVYTEMFDRDIKVNHIELVKNSDYVVLVPATLNIIGKLANGIADDLVSTTLSVVNPEKLLIFPAMNTNMYLNPINQNNMEKLRSFGYKIVEPVVGNLACNDVGIGKLPEVDDIVEEIIFNMNFDNFLKSKNILITAGGTKEYIDPVRYISNESSGKMGYSLAKYAAILGANVTLISTKKELKVPKGVKNIIYVDTAKQMHDEVFKNLENIDAVIKVAAVSDFRVKEIAKNKIKKKENLNLELVKNPDILQELSKIENRKFKLIGFAAETENIFEHAKEKLKRKNLDYIILNDVSKKEIGFNSDQNEVYIINKNSDILKLNKDTKDKIALSILKNIFNDR